MACQCSIAGRRFTGMEDGDDDDELVHFGMLMPHKHFSIILDCVFNCALFPLYYLQNRPLPKLPIRLSCFDIIYRINATECPASDDGPVGATPTGFGQDRTIDQLPEQLGWKWK